MEPNAAMERPAQLPAVRISDIQREQAAELLQRACGDGRLTLEEFSVRVGAVWAADTSAELDRATGGLAEPPVVGGGRVEEKVVNVFGESKRAGRWRLPRALRVTNVFGSCELDLRESAVGPEAMHAQVVTITGKNVFGEVKVIVPEGVEVELTGACVFGSRELRLAPVARLSGTPVIKVDVNTYFGQVSVRSRGPASDSALSRWLRDTFHG
jgi:Domain of unknown function (DUF1707)/Cell wall-active antibiotics response 4TMS YvqF